MPFVKKKKKNYIKFTNIGFTRVSRTQSEGKKTEDIKNFSNFGLLLMNVLRIFR